MLCHPEEDKREEGQEGDNVDERMRWAVHTLTTVAMAISQPQRLGCSH
jgi:hypothetical protein